MRWQAVVPSGTTRCVHLVALKRGYRVGEICAELGCKERRLHEVFLRDIGLTPKQWMRQERMVVARRMLSAGIAPDDVAQRLGFTTKNNFRREFQAHHHVTPTLFQEQRRQPSPVLIADG